MERRIAGVQSTLGNNALSIVQRAKQERFQTTESLARDNTRFAELSSMITTAQTQASTSAAQAAGAIASTAGKRQSRVAQDMALIAEGLGEFGKRFNKDVVDQQKALRTKEFSNAFIQMNNLAANAGEMIHKTSPDLYEKQILETIGRYAHITGEDVQQLANVGYGALRAVNSQRHQRMLTEMDNVRKSVTAQQKAELEWKLTGVFSQIENTHQEATPLAGKALEITNKFLTSNPNIDPLAALQIHTSVLTELKDKVGVNFQQRQEIQNQLEGLQGFQQELAPFFAQMRSGEISVNMYQAKLNELAVKNGLQPSLGKDIGDPFAAEDMALRQLQAEQKLNEIHQQGVARDLSADLLSTKSIGNITAMLLGEEGNTFRARIDSQPGLSDRPAFAAALKLADDWEEFQQFEFKTKNEVDTINRQLADFQAQSEAFVISKTSDRDQMESFLTTFKKMYQGSPVLPTPPDSREENLESWLTWREESIRQMQRQVTNRQNELFRREKPFKQYNLRRTPEEIQADYEEQLRVIESTHGKIPQGGFVGGTQPNFKQGVPRDNAAVAPRDTAAFASVTDKNGQVMLAPVRAEDAGKIRVTSHYNAIRGQRRHGGVDIGAPAGTPMISPVSGTVVTAASRPQDYGYFIDVKDDETGQIHRFAHMPGLMVTQGQKLRRGDVFGKVGSTGRSTGAHIHWELRTSVGGRRENTRDPMSWAREQHSNPPRQRGDNRAWHREADNPYSTSQDEYDETSEKTIPGNAMPMEAAFMLNNRVYQKGEDLNGGTPANEVYLNSRPYRQSFVPSGKRDFVPEVDNAPGQNWGYAKLGRNQKAADKIGEIASRLGIPAVWLVDVMAFESGLDPSIDNGYDPDGDGHGYVGLIQLGKQAAKDIGVDIAEVKRMSFTEQLEKVVYPYLNLPWFRGKLNSVEQVLASIFGGPGLVDKLERNRGAAFNTGDINIKFGAYLRRLGKDAGRSYEIRGLNDRRSRVNNILHDEQVAGCNVCNDMLRSSSMIVPHELA